MKKKKSVRCEQTLTFSVRKCYIGHVIPRLHFQFNNNHRRSGQVGRFVRFALQQKENTEPGVSFLRFKHGQRDSEDHSESESKV